MAWRFSEHDCIMQIAHWVVQFAFKAAKPNKYREGD
jgi:hypothetical protein